MVPRRRLLATDAQVTVAAVLSRHELNSGKNRRWIRKRQDSSTSTTEITESTTGPEPTESSLPLDSSSFSGPSSSTEIPSSKPLSAPTDLIQLPTQSLPPPAPSSEPVVTVPPPSSSSSSSTEALPDPSSTSQPPLAEPSNATPSQSEVVQVPSSSQTPTVTPSSSPPESERPDTSTTTSPSRPPSVPLPSPPASDPPEIPTDPVASSTGIPLLVPEPNPDTNSNPVVPEPTASAPSTPVAVNNAEADEPVSSVLASSDTHRVLATPTRLAINVGSTDEPLIQTFTEEIASVVPSIADDGLTVNVPVTLTTTRIRTASEVATGIPTAESIPSRDDPSSSSRAAVIGGSIGGVVVFLLVGVFVLILLRRRARSKKSLNADFIFAHPSTGNPFNSEPSMMESGRLRRWVLSGDANINPPSHPDGRSDPFQSPDRVDSLSGEVLSNPFDDPTPPPTRPSPPSKPWMSATRSSGGSWDQGYRASQVSLGVAV